MSATAVLHLDKFTHSVLLAPQQHSSKDSLQPSGCQISYRNVGQDHHTVSAEDDLRRFFSRIEMCELNSDQSYHGLY